MSDPVKIEYQVRVVERYIVTRFEQGPVSEAGTCAGGSAGRGEYDNADTAYEVGYALAKAEHERLGWPLGDERIQYPRHPKEGRGALIAAAGQVFYAE